MTSPLRRATGDVSVAQDLQRNVRVVLVALAFVLGLVAFPIAGLGAGTTVAADAFSRVATGTWGIADMGWTYYYGGPSSAFSVGSGVGTMRLGAAGMNLAAWLGSTSSTDVDMKVLVRTNKLPIGGPISAYALVRHSAAN